MKPIFTLLMLLSSSAIAATNGSGMPVVEDTTLYGKHLQLIAPAPAGEKQDVNACVAIGYLVKPNGSLGDFEVLDTWSSKPPMRSNQRHYWEGYGEVAAQAVRAAQAKVRMSPPAEAVRTVSHVSFGPDAAQNDKCMALNAHDIYTAADANRMTFEAELREQKLLRLADRQRNAEILNAPNLTASPQPSVPAPPPSSPRAQSGVSN